MAGMITKKEAALYYARRRWAVFPLYEPNEKGGCSCGKPDCSSSAKHPRTKHGVLDATTNEARIEGWWTQWREANIGLATGKVSGFVVLDIDPARGGEKSFDELQAKYGRIPETLQCSTGGGGRHLYFLSLQAANEMRVEPRIVFTDDDSFWNPYPDGTVLFDCTYCGAVNKASSEICKLCRKPLRKKAE